jgi:hypothetical protein
MGLQGLLHGKEHNENRLLLVTDQEGHRVQFGASVAED